MVQLFELFGIWVGALLSLMILSFLYRENPMFRIAEFLIVGLSAGFAFAGAFWIFQNQALIPLLYKGRTDYVVPILIGVLTYAQLTKRYSFLYRLPLSLALGFGVGNNIRGVMQGLFIRQIQATIIPIVAPDPTTTVNSAVIVFGTILSVLYFMFFREKRGAWGSVTRLGRYLIILTLGAIFGSTVQGRMALLIQRTQFLLGDAAFPWRALRMGTFEEGRWAWTAIPVFILVFVLYSRWQSSKTLPPSTTR